MERQNGDRRFDNHRGGFSGDGHNHHHQQQQQDYHHYNYHDHHPNYYDHHPNNHFMNNEPNGSFGPGHHPPLSGRKRGFHHSNRATSPDYVDRGRYAKLYVAYIPRTATEDDIRSLFQECGNVVEVVLLKDKRTGQQHGACFVKYATVEEADRAIRVLDNLHTFPGVYEPLKVRYADGEQERLGGLGEKLYVGCLYKQASMKEIEEIFSPYGVIEDIYIVRDEMKQSRGCGFIKFSHRDMAETAINALNGTYIMRGCDQPLIVRFADPKKPRNGNSRGNFAFGGPNFGPRSQEPLTRSQFSNDEPRGGRSLSNAACLSNSGAAEQHISASSQSQAVTHVANQPQGASNAMERPCHLLQHPLSQVPNISAQLPQNLRDCTHPSQQVVSEIQRESNLIQPLTQNLEQKQKSQVTSQQSQHSEICPQAVSMATGSAAALTSTTSTTPVVLESTQTAASLDCDWSEHTCPDGCKYYFNCVTCESRWEKPEEYTSFEQMVLKKLESLSCQQQELRHVNTQTSPVAACVQQVSGI